jgi:hypothetical protein
MTKFDPAFWSAVAAILSLFVTVLATAAAVWQGIITRRHNLLSVRPEIFIQIVGLNAANHPIGIFIRNRGLGPARITRVLYTDTFSSISNENEQGFTEIFRPLVELHKLMDGAQIETLRPGNIIPSGETISFFWIAQPEPNPLLLRQLFSRLQIAVEYESLYRQKMAPAWMNPLPS